MTRTSVDGPSSGKRTTTSGRGDSRARAPERACRGVKSEQAADQPYAMNKLVVAASRAANAGTRLLRRLTRKRARPVGTGADERDCAGRRGWRRRIWQWRRRDMPRKWPVSPPREGPRDSAAAPTSPMVTTGDTIVAACLTRENSAKALVPSPRRGRPVKEEPPESDRGLGQDRDSEVAEHGVHPAPAAAESADRGRLPARRCLAGALPVERHVHILPTRRPTPLCREASARHEGRHRGVRRGAEWPGRGHRRHRARAPRGRGRRDALRGCRRRASPEYAEPLAPDVVRLAPTDPGLCAGGFSPTWPSCPSASPGRAGGPALSRPAPWTWCMASARARPPCSRAGSRLQCKRGSTRRAFCRGCIRCSSSPAGLLTSTSARPRLRPRRMAPTCSATTVRTSCW